MRATRPGLVDITREFLGAHQLMRHLFSRYRAGELRFPELAALIGDDEESLLFRLKERCHARFRAGDEGGGPAHRDALFDLAVGSLFHEAMKFRENLYQREIYGPRVEALRSEADPEEALLFEEFARIQDGVSMRLEEGLVECETLLARTVEQLGHLLVANRDEPLVARFLVEHTAEVEAAIERPVASLLALMYGDAASGYRRAATSLLESGYYEDALRTFDVAIEHGGDAASLAPWLAYARGMAAYLARDYVGSVDELASWAAHEEAVTPELARLAHDAVARAVKLARDEEGEQIGERADDLLTRLGRLADAA